MVSVFKNFNPLPEDLDIVYCLFPDRQRLPHVMAPLQEPHYCLVLGADEDNHSVIVCYGTSQINIRSSNDFILTDEYLQSTGLYKSTKWSFTPGSIAILDYNQKFFKVKKNSPVCGKFPLSQIDSLNEIFLSDPVQEILNDLWNSGLAILPKKDWKLKKYYI